MFSIYCRPKNYIILLLLLFVASINAYFLDPLLKYNVLHNDDEFDLSKRQLAPRSSSLEHATPLRILCLGASITYGFHSTDGNGYRYALRGKLIADGNDVNMIGYVNAGNMSNNNVEAFPGYRIGQVQGKGNLSLPLLPNVVLIFLGTNDMTQNFEVSAAADRMSGFIQNILDKVPQVTVIVSTLLPNAKTSTEANTLIFNAALPAMVANFTAHGQKVSLVDMHSDWFSLSDLGPDGTHPTDMGYLKMSRVFYNGIKAAAATGNITRPVQVDGVDDYRARNDSKIAGTVMNVVCQNVNSTAQQQQCSEAGRLGFNAGFALVLALGIGLML